MTSHDGSGGRRRARASLPRTAWLALGAGAGLAGWYAADTARLHRLHARIRARHARGPRVVVLGAGFGGLTCAAELARRLPPGAGREVLLVDRHNYQLFTPLLYHAATGLVDPSHIQFPVRSLARTPHFRFYEGVVRGVNFARRRVLLDEGEIEYDLLVIALGSTTNYFGNERFAERSLPLKNLGDAIAVRNQVIRCFERAEQMPPGPDRDATLTFVVVGGGATGVELMGHSTASPARYSIASIRAFRRAMCGSCW